ncbi:MAG TPA: cytochrome d ubiquinol oxidase subunit II [Verrucomicrobiae bacterium]|nr:cytochrome d ubiquinol oxidase subunit II [Verrucomicrobiae bacterium]
METVWFCLLALVAAIYGILDGYDLGVGALYPFIGRTPEERESVRRTILPVWDGNEVWLIAGGGILFFSFPVAYSSGFAGFYLAFFVLLWLLIPRGLALELRDEVPHPLTRGFCDGVFFWSSTLLGFLFGVALGNVLRGVPLDASGYFFVPFWTIMGLGPHPGVFDWYTVLAGFSTLAVLMVHGSAFAAARTVGPVRNRARQAAKYASVPAVMLSTAWAALSPVANPVLNENYFGHPWAYALPVGAGVAGLAMIVLAWLGRERGTFIASSTAIVLSVGASALALYPRLLPSTLDHAQDLTIYNSGASHYALTAGLVWGAFGLTLAFGYSVFAHYKFRGRVPPQANEGAASQAGQLH